MSLLLVWLWNPGEEYRHTRHNAWRIVCSSRARDQSEQWGGAWTLRPLKRVSSLQGRLSQWSIDLWDACYRVAIYFPWSYMNVSWPWTLKAMEYVWASIEQTLIVYDDADIPQWTTKLKLWWSHWGHNGLRDIFQKAWTNTFARLKCWIGRPSHPAAGLKDYVLWTMRGEELDQWVIRPEGTDEKIQQWMITTGYR